MIYYSAKTRGFYDSKIHTDLPNDAVEISDELHYQLLSTQANGKIIVPDETGCPIAVDAPIVVATVEQNKTEAKARLLSTDWVNQPDVYDVASSPRLTNRDEFLGYRNAVREIAINPVSGNINWPIEPIAVWVS